MANGHGGKRPGAGKPKGSVSKIAQARIAKVSAIDRKPLDRMLTAMAIFEGLAERYRPRMEGDQQVGDEEKFVRYVGLMADRAKDAAPYFHHKLAPVDRQGIAVPSVSNSGPVNVFVDARKQLVSLVNREVARLEKQQGTGPDHRTPVGAG